jgi:hypothetical protein
MKTKISSFISSRRQFLLKTLPAGTLLCLGCKNLSGFPDILDPQKISTQKHKFLEDSGMTVEQVFRFSFENGIPILQALAKDIGREKFLEMLKKASNENNVQFAKTVTKDFPKRDFAAFVDWNIKSMNVSPYNKAVTFEIVEKTDKVFEMKVTECLYAKILREMNAADIGYITICDPDGAFNQAFNPKIKGTNPKNLMKGDDVCIGRFIWEG